MKLAMVLLHTGELPHRLEFVCPVCKKDNHVILPGGLGNLSCQKCSTKLDGSQASIEIIAVQVTAPMDSGTLRDTDFSEAAG